MLQVNGEYLYLYPGVLPVSKGNTPVLVIKIKMTVKIVQVVTMVEIQKDKKPVKYASQENGVATKEQLQQLTQPVQLARVASTALQHQVSQKRTANFALVASMEILLEPIIHQNVNPVNLEHTPMTVVAPLSVLLVFRASTPICEV